MGPDGVEFLRAAEEAFDVRISNAEAERLATPHDLVDLLCARLPTTGEAPSHGAETDGDGVRRWSRGEIERRVVELIETEAGVDRADFTLDSSITRDIGLN